MARKSNETSTAIQAMRGESRRICSPKTRLNRGFYPRTDAQFLDTFFPLVLAFSSTRREGFDSTSPWLDRLPFSLKKPANVSGGMTFQSVEQHGFPPK